MRNHWNIILATFFIFLVGLWSSPFVLSEELKVDERKVSSNALVKRSAVNPKLTLEELKVNPYSLWGKYDKIPIEKVTGQPWRSQEDVISGWDWSFPPSVKYAKNGYICTERSFNIKWSLAGKLPKPTVFNRKPVVSLWYQWKNIEPEEGKYRFDLLAKRMAEAERQGYKVVLRLLSSAKKSAPDWLEKAGAPLAPKTKKGKIINFDVSHPLFHSRYLKLIEKLGKSGIPRDKTLAGAYLGYASSSFGDEGIGPHGENPDKVPHVIERMKAWQKAFKGHEAKVFMGGVSQKGLEMGFGTRRGFVEMFLYHIPSKEAAQRVNTEGYLLVNEKSSIVDGRFLGEENEEYEEAWATKERGFRFGKDTKSFNYRYFTSNLRMLQMRCNYALFNSFTIAPEQFAWVTRSLGHSAETSADVWCALRESYVTTYYFRNAKAPFKPKDQDHKMGVPVKNFERWLYQRDAPGFETEPVVKVPHPIKMWMVPKERAFDYIARKGRKIGFEIEPLWLNSKGKSHSLKITYFDQGKGELKLKLKTATGPKEKAVVLTNTGELRTVTFSVGKILTDPNGFDFVLEGSQGDLWVSFVRVIKH